MDRVVTPMDNPSSVHVRPPRTLTLREYYAGLAMQTLLAKHDPDQFPLHVIVRMSCAAADELINRLDS